MIADKMKLSRPTKVGRFFDRKNRIKTENVPNSCIAKYSKKQKENRKEVKKLKKSVKNSVTMSRVKTRKKLETAKK